MKLLDDYYKAKKEIYEYFGCDITHFFLDDSREFYWSLDGDQVSFGETPEEIEMYANELCYSRECGNRVFRKDDYTLLLVTDSFNDNTAQIFDNSKEIKE